MVAAAADSSPSSIIETARAGGRCRCTCPERGTLAALPADPPSFVVEERLRGTVGTTYQGGVKSGVYVAGYVLTGADDHEVGRRAQELARWYATGVRWTGHHGEDDHAALD
ncbi:hypothetical protein GCM10011428_35400 [Streptomyces violaceus]